MVWKSHYQLRLFDAATVLYASTDALPEDGIGEAAARIRYTASRPFLRVGNDYLNVFLAKLESARFP